MNSKNKRLLQRVRVPLGFVLSIAFLVFAEPRPLSLLVGTPMAVAGLLIRAWASGHIRKNQALTISGPYAYTRNPLYLGSLILGVGFCIAAGVWWLALGFAVLFSGVYLPVMRVEAEDLTGIFGAEYKEYARSVPLFFPAFAARKKTNVKFDFELYLRYREYRAALGLLFAIAVLAFKAFYLQ
ncbi:MAG TPA: isoprenylcysteine carboxylmethyltransferase family protein [Pyrinomonadaceae bacterium]|jgi:protein-S-isoprenylcysteine O-methyltransferase Ste14